jgi:hypothetical protein
MRCDATGEKGRRERTSDERTNERGRVGAGRWALGTGHWALGRPEVKAQGPKCATRTYAGDGGDKRDFSHSTREAMDCGLWIVDCGLWIVDSGRLWIVQDPK